MVNARISGSRFWKWVLGIVGFFVLRIIVLSYLIPNDFLRRYAERQMNRPLTYYTVRIGQAYFHPIGLSLDLDNLVLIQNEIPDPPVASIKRLHASVHWTALIKGMLVGDFLIDRPKLYINLKQARKEAESETTLGQKGWQDALEAVYPLKIDVFRIRNGALTYVDQGPYKPLQAGEIFLHATNIRRDHYPLEGGQAMEAGKGGAMRLRLRVTCCSVLFLALLSSPIAADMGSPSHNCSKPKPYDPMEYRSKSDVEMYNDSVDRYKRCIEEFVGEQNKAVNRHHEAALAATEEYNSFVKAWKK